jgi:predicted ATP-dependent endonuclease of OLD family
MYLKTLVIINYKSCQYLEIEPYKDDPTVLIGINDCGKSTMLKAIGLLLDPKPVYHFQEDGSMKNDLAHNRVSASLLQENLETLDLPMLPYADTENDKTFVLGKLILEQAELDEIAEKECTSHLGWTLDGHEDDEIKSIWLARSFHLSAQQEKLYLLTPDTTDNDAFYDMNQTNLKRAQQTLSISDEMVEN